MNDCLTCHKPDCERPDREYFPKSDVQRHYCRMQIVWCICHSDILDCGTWVAVTTGYKSFRLDVQISMPQSAPHEDTYNVWGEIAVRLLKAGKDGQTLQDEVNGFLRYLTNETTTDTPEAIFWQKYYSGLHLSRAAWNALNYCSGRKRRIDSYRKWLYDQKEKSDKSRKEKTLTTTSSIKVLTNTTDSV